MHIFCSLPSDESLHYVYCPLAELKAHAAQRLQTPQLQYPERAAWRSIIEGKIPYGVDGTRQNEKIMGGTVASQ